MRRSPWETRQREITAGFSRRQGEDLRFQRERRLHHRSVSAGDQIERPAELQQPLTNAREADAELVLPRRECIAQAEGKRSMDRDVERYHAVSGQVDVRFARAGASDDVV